MPTEFLTLKVNDDFVAGTRLIKAEYRIHDSSHNKPCLIYMGGISADTFGPEAVKPLEVIQVAEELGLNALRFNYVGHGQGERKSDGLLTDSSISGAIADIFAVIDHLPSQQPVVLVGSSISVAAFSFAFRRYGYPKIKAALGLIPLFAETFLAHFQNKFPLLRQLDAPQRQQYFAEMGGSLRTQFKGMSHVDVSITLAQYNDLLLWVARDQAPVSFAGPFNVVMRESDPMSQPEIVLPRLQAYRYPQQHIDVMPGAIHNVGPQVIYDKLKALNLLDEAV